jgi:uncharacterized damage-inducible protein DinB
MADGELLTAIRDSRTRLLKSIEGMDEEATKQRPAAEEWSVIEVLAHMAAVDDSYLGQALAARESPGIVFKYFNDDGWKAAHPGPDDFALPRVLSDLRASHQRVIAEASALTAEELAHPCIHPRGIPYTVRDILARLPAHDANHQRQIEDLRGLLGR